MSSDLQLFINLHANLLTRILRGSGDFESHFFLLLCNIKVTTWTRVLLIKKLELNTFEIFQVLKRIFDESLLVHVCFVHAVPPSDKCCTKCFSVTASVLETQLFSPSKTHLLPPGSYFAGSSSILVSRIQCCLHFPIQKINAKDAHACVRRRVVSQKRRYAVKCARAK